MTLWKDQLVSCSVMDSRIKDNGEARQDTVVKRVRGCSISDSVRLFILLNFLDWLNLRSTVQILCTSTSTWTLGRRHRQPDREGMPTRLEGDWGQLESGLTMNDTSYTEHKGGLAIFK